MITPLLKSKIFFGIICAFFLTFFIFKLTQDGSKYMDTYIKPTESKSSNKTNDAVNEEKKKNANNLSNKLNEIKIGLMDEFEKLNKTGNNITDLISNFPDFNNITEAQFDFYKEKIKRFKENLFGEFSKLEEKIKEINIVGGNGII